MGRPFCFVRLDFKAKKTVKMTFFHNIHEGVCGKISPCTVLVHRLKFRQAAAFIGIAKLLRSLCFHLAHFSGVQQANVFKSNILMGAFREGSGVLSAAKL